MAKIQADIDQFFSIIRALEHQLIEHPDKRPDRHLLGTDTSPEDEPVRFRFSASTAFASGLNQATVLDVNTDETQPELDVNFLGLLGPSGALPQHYTQLVIERLRKHDHAMADFINIFNHRLISLYYRAWGKYKLPLQYDRYLHSPARDPFTLTLKSLSGQRSQQRYDAPLFYSGHFSKINRSGANLEAMLSHFLRTSVKITSFVGQWLLIQKPDRLVIGSRRRGRNNQLGNGVLPGRRFWDIQSKISLTIGELTHEEFHDLLPGTDRFNQLSQLINSYTPIHISVDLLFIVEDAMKNSLPLGKGIALSQNAWLHGKNKSTLGAKIRLKRLPS